MENVTEKNTHTTGPFTYYSRSGIIKKFFRRLVNSANRR